MIELNLKAETKEQELIKTYLQENVSEVLAEKINNGVKIVVSTPNSMLFGISAVGDTNNSIEIRYVDENIWLTPKMPAELYGVKVSTINEHINKIFADNELTENATIWKFRITATDGKSYNTWFFENVG